MRQAILYLSEQPVESQEIPLVITPQQAAHGVILSVPLSTGTARLRIPPARDGDLVRARVGGEEVLLRIRVAPAAAPVSDARGCLVALAVAVAVIVGVILLNSGDDDGDRSAAPRPTPSYSSWSPAPAPPPASVPADPVDPPSEAAPTPFDRGTCLNGSLPDSTTAQRVTGVKEVPCSASDAHYRVIESIPLTSDLNRCNDNPKTQYAFSYRYSRGGVTINEYVYCLVGLGSYSRG
ncbi:hypothetical protein ABZZ20_25230 [Streptomyces sp. NPDC006430]|uniref:LppU/SCO3897 family protein n=1 Tax=Streptomyces sp. NPDC006430 TaxID=3154299 RepID=UPI0033B36437